MLAVYPGSFDPPTIAHLAVAEAALAVEGIAAVRFVLSEDPLGKGDGAVPVPGRLGVLQALSSARPGLGAGTTRARLLVDIAVEADAAAVVVGADKWDQVLDPHWYGGSLTARDRALAALRLVLLAPRAGAGEEGPRRAPPPHVRVVALDVHADHRHVSATRARQGEPGLMADEARASGLWR